MGCAVSAPAAPLRQPPQLLDLCHPRAAIVAIDVRVRRPAAARKTRPPQPQQRLRSAAISAESASLAESLNPFIATQPASFLALASDVADVTSAECTPQMRTFSPVNHVTPAPPTDAAGSSRPSSIWMLSDAAFETSLEY
jgi:hypothetical protein